MQVSISDNDEINYFRVVSVDKLDDLAALLLNHNFSPGLYKDGKRSLANFQGAFCIGMDIDNDGKKNTPMMTIEEAKEAFKDYRHIIMPSRSHRKEKHGKVADRFRVILFFDKAVEDLETMYATWFWCKSKWPAIDPQCKDPSRFYFKHQSIYSTCLDGLLVTPVAPLPVIPSEPKDLGRLLPGDRGKLSKESMDWLENGIEKGGRNGSVYKLAKDMQQNLYTLDEAMEIILSKLKENGTINASFREGEAKSAVKSAFGSEPKHEPRIEERAFKMVKIGDLYKEKHVVEWRVEKLLSAGGLSIISGDPKAGKSTLVRQLIRDVLKGTPFLGRDCIQGGVHYFGLEEQTEYIQSSFQKLGVTGDDPLHVHVGGLLGYNVLSDLKATLDEFKPRLAVIDTLFDLVIMDDINNYSRVKVELAKLRAVARETNTHILCVHHNSKGSGEHTFRGSRAIMGSSAIAGAMDTIITMELKGNTRHITSQGRGIDPWTKQALVYDYKSETYSLGSTSYQEDEF